MTLRGEITKGYAAFQALTFYEKLEQISVLVLSGLIAIVIVAALWSLALRVVRGLVLEGSLDPTNSKCFRAYSDRSSRSSSRSISSVQF